MTDDLKSSTEFCYTLSSNGSMVKEAIHSIKTLKNYVPPDKINVIFTPPSDPEDIEKISSLDVKVVQKKNRAETFQVSDYDYDRSYGDKMWLCSIESKNLVFLDCDTLVLGDIWEVIKGDFEFKARPTEEEMTDEWEQLFHENQLKFVDKMFNAGFLVFKNNSHEAIEENWEKYYRQLENKSYSESGNIHREQYALALAVSELNIEEMDESEHLMEWTDDVRSDSMVYHLSGPQWTYKEYLQEFVLRTKNLDLKEALRKRLR
jgi:hypothetical protein